MQRRDLLRILGNTVAATVLAPLSATERLRLGSLLHASAAPSPLPPEQFALVARLSDVIMPRTDTPGATDVGVPAFIERILAWWDTTEERDRFLMGLALIGEGLATTGNANAMLMALDSAAERPDGSAEQAWSRLKSMVVYGYFTSREVQESVLHTVILPGRFDGCVTVGS